MADLCDDEEMRQVVLKLIDEIQHKHLSELRSGTVGADRHNSSIRR